MTVRTVHTGPEAARGLQVWTTPASGDFYVELLLTSADPHFNGNRPRVRVRSCCSFAGPAGWQLLHSQGAWPDASC